LLQLKLSVFSGFFKPEISKDKNTFPLQPSTHSNHQERSRTILETGMKKLFKISNIFG